MPQKDWLHHSLCFIPSIAYTGPECNIYKTQLHKLKIPYIQVLSKNLGFNRCYNRELLFGPESLGGIGAYDLRIEAGLSGVETIVRNFRTPGNSKSIILLFL